MQALPEGVTTAAELRAHYKRAAKNIIRPKPVLVVDNTPEAVPVPVFYVQPRVIYFKQPSPYNGDGAPHLPKMSDLMRAVCEFYRCSDIDIISSRRTASIVKPRHVLMYLARKMTTKSLPDIGRFLGGKDHTSVLHGIRRIDLAMIRDVKVAEEVAAIRARVNDILMRRRLSQ